MSVRTLLFSTLYPSSERPLHGTFVETRLLELLKEGGIETRVISPVPWFYSTAAKHGARAAMARTPLHERWHGVDVRHPKYLVIPKIGMSLAPWLLAMASRAAVQSLLDEGFDFDVIDAHYYYPDGVAAALLAGWFNKPLVITARGSDVNLLARYALPRRLMRWAAGKASFSIAVSAALAHRVLEVGASRDTVKIMRNGVDAEKFRPEPPALARQRLNLSGRPLLLSVGNLFEVKRHGLVIDALVSVRQQHPSARLVIVGAGPLREKLEAQCRQSGLQSAVTFAGAVAQDELRWWYSAADALILASSREGWPNVLLEAMACGTPVVASKVGGVEEVVAMSEAGFAVDMPDAASLARAIGALLDRRPDRAVVRSYALSMGWAETSRAQLDLFCGLAMRPDRNAAPCEMSVP